MTIFFLFTLAAGLGATVPTTVTRAEFCKLILSPGDTQADQLTEDVVRRIGVEENHAQFSYMADMRQVMRDLVQKGTISDAQASAFFAEKILGGYSRIFLKFTIAELLGRGFERRDIVHTVIHFDDAFSADRQVKFALDVARRMLLTVNEDPGMSSPEGIRAFMAAVAVFKIEPDTYANFLRLWAFVRESDPHTIVQFILGNIKNAGLILQEDVRVSLAQTSARQISDSAAATSGWLATLLKPARSARSTLVAPDFESVAQEFLDVDAIPDWILNVAGLPQTTDQPLSFLERYRSGNEAAAKAYLTGLENHPPFALDFIVRAELPRLSFATLNLFVRTPTYLALGDETRAIGDAILADFWELRRLENAFKKALEDAKAPAAPAMLANPMTGNQMFLKSAMDYIKAGQMNKATIFGVIMKAFDHADEQVQHQIDGRDFVILAVQIIDRVCAENDLAIGAAGMKAVMAISHGFDLSSGQISEIFRIMKTHRFYNTSRQLRAMDYYSDFATVLQPKSWGRTRPTPSATLSPAARAVLEEIKAFFERRHDNLEDFEVLRESLTKSSGQR